MNIELGKRSGRRPGFLFAGPLARQTSFAGYQHPDGGLCRRGDGSVPQLRRSGFVTASARFGTLAHKTNGSACARSSPTSTRRERQEVDVNLDLNYERTVSGKALSTACIRRAAKYSSGSNPGSANARFAAPAELPGSFSALRYSTTQPCRRGHDSGD
jgi:hypothetical protein